MLPVVNKPIMEHILKLLHRHGFLDLYATLQFLPSVIINYFGDGSEWGVRLNYMLEQSPLGTAGSVKNCEGYLDETFLVVSGDALTDIDLSEAIAFHRSRGGIATLVLIRVSNPLEFGIVVTAQDGLIERFLEKPNWGQVFSDTINTGIYILEPEILQYIPEDRPFDFSQDLFPLLLEKGFPLYGFVSDGYWCDIGNFAQYMRAHKDVLEGKVKIIPEGFEISKGVWLGEDAEIDREATVKPPVVIGSHSKIEREARVREYSVIGANVVVKQGSFIHRSVLFDNSYIGSGCHLRGCVVGKNCDLKANVRVEEGVVIGDDCLIGENALINHDVKIYPFKMVEQRATINTSIIWESRGMRTLFGRGGITGIMNVDITPENALRIAMAYGSLFPRDSHVVTSRDASRQARTIKRSIITGLNATGINVLDLEISPVPVNRLFIKMRGAVGGVDVRISPYDPQSIEIRFFDSEGIDISEGLQRNIEKVYSQSDFRRAFANELGAIHFPHRALEMYIQALQEKIDMDLVRKSPLKIVVDCAYGSTSMIIPSILGRMGCEVLTLHAFLDEERAIIGMDELSGGVRQVGELVKSSGADLGVVIDGSGERIFLTDDQGSAIDLNLALLLFVRLISERYQGVTIAVPVSASSVVERIAGAAGNRVLRTKVSRSALMEAALKPEIVFAGANGGGYIFPDLLPAYDGMISIVKLLELLAYMGKPLSHHLKKIPRISYLTQDIPASWENIGLIMRRIKEESDGKQVDYTDGIKVFLDENNWMLVLPDAEEPLLHLIVDAESPQRGKSIIEEYLKLVQEMIE
jgi:mannose-1-phosphate guanylyltransferase/phosphomannomutase